MINVIRVDLQMVTPNVQRRTRRYIFKYLGFVDVIFTFLYLYIYIYFLFVHFVISYFNLFYLFVLFTHLFTIFNRSYKCPRMYH